MNVSLRYVAVFLWTSIFLSASVSAQNSLSLSAIVDEVIARNPGLQAQRFHRDAARAMMRQSRAMALPQLGVYGQVMRGNDPVYVFGSLLRQNQFGTQNFAIDSLNRPDDQTNFSHGVDVGVPLFTGFELSSFKKMSSLGEQQAAEQFTLASQMLMRNVTQIVLNALWTREQIDLIKQRIQSSAEELASAERLKSRGLVLGSDNEAAKAIYGTFELRLVQAEQAHAASLSALGTLMGVSTSSFAVQGHLLDPLYSEQEIKDLSVHALSRRSDLSEVRLALEMSEVSKTQASRSFLPRVDAFGQLESNSEHFLQGSPVHVMGVRSRIPLGDPTYFSRKDKSSAQAAAVERRVAFLEESVRLEVSEAMTRYQTAVQSRSLAARVRSQAEQSLRLFRPLYREGRQSILDVLQAEDHLLAAELMALETRFRVHEGYLGVVFASGAMNQDQIRQMDRYLTEVQP